MEVVSEKSIRTYEYSLYEIRKRLEIDGTILNMSFDIRGFDGQDDKVVVEVLIKNNIPTLEKKGRKAYEIKGDKIK